MRTKVISAGKLLALTVFITVAVSLIVYLWVHNIPKEVGSNRSGLPPKIKIHYDNPNYTHQSEGRVRFILQAKSEDVYEDGKHELEEVKLESHGADGTRNDVLTADKAVVINTNNMEALEAECTSNVLIKTSDGMTIKTNYAKFNEGTKTIESNELVEFEGRGIQGKTTGVLINTETQKADLLKDVDITYTPGVEKPGDKEKESAKTDATGREETAAEREERIARKLARKAERRRLEAANAAARNPSGDKAKKSGGKTQPAEPAHITSNSAVIEMKEHLVTFIGSVVLTRGAGEVQSDKLVGYLDENNHIQRIEARGNSILSQKDKAEVASADMDFFFDENQKLTRAVANTHVTTRSLSGEPERDAQADSAEMTFTEDEGGKSSPESLLAKGNARVRIHAPKSAPGNINPTERELTADTIQLAFYPAGSNIKTATASGNAYLTVTPVRSEPGAEKRVISAPQMTGDFFEKGNRIKTFNAIDGVRVQSLPMVDTGQEARITTSRLLVAEFNPDQQGIDRISQEGDFKYNEGDRNGAAERAVYDAKNERINLRGKRPIGWDSNSRVQADEIDFDRLTDEMHARGDVRTTYYNPKSVNNSTPFKKDKSPVIATAARLDESRRTGVAIYTGSAHGWQDDNFVRADRIELFQNDKRMIATGHVESALYNMKRENGGKSEMVPCFVNANKMTYSDGDRMIRYDVGVKALQGDDRIDAATMEVYLEKESSGVNKMIADGGVVMTQPGRKAVGDHLVYTAADENAVLTGKNARVDDKEKGTIMGSQLTFNKRDDKISVENQRGAGRVRSTHRLISNRESR